MVMSKNTNAFGAAKRISAQNNVDFDINILKSELYRYNYNITLGQIRAIRLEFFSS